MMELEGQGVLEQYEKSDFSDRLNLFLENPALREQFTTIEQTTPSTSQTHRKPKNRLLLPLHILACKWRDLVTF